MNTGFEEYEKMDKFYPNRHTEIHKEACKNCPSTRGDDPETLDLKANCSIEYIAKETAFVCAWRQSKLCKGYCDSMGISQELMNKVRPTR